MKILVTGAAGFIAAKVIELLLSEGHEVAGVDDLNDAYDVRLKQYRLQALRGDSAFSFERVDIADRAAIARAWAALGPFDAVINLAARAGVHASVIDPWVYQTTNVVGTLNLLHLCTENGVRKFILASTSSLYGAVNSLPFSEDDNTDFPLSPYAASKKGAEALCYTYHHLYGIDITIFRYFTVYGPAGRPDMSLLRFVKWIYEDEPVQVYGDGRQSRDFTYVDDIARGTVLGLREVGFEVINLGDDHPADLAFTIRTIEALSGKKARIRYSPAHPSDVRATWANVEKAKRLLGWQPRVGLEEGISRLVTWYEGNRSWARAIELGRG